MTALSSFLLAVQMTLLVSVSSIEVHTANELQVKNGTDARLKCTFSSSSPLGDDITVSWTFRPLKGGSEESVFYYHKQPFPQNQGHFGGRAVWDGNVKRSDGSIIIRNIQATDNGTYLCHVKNPPDVHGEMGEIIVTVVDKEKFSEILLLVLVIGVGSLVIILLVLVVVLCRFYRKQKTRSTAVSMLECEKLNEKPHDLSDANA